MFKGYPFSKRTYYRRLKKAKRLGCDIMDVPDLRGRHDNHVRGKGHWKWNGGDPPPDPAKRRASAKNSAKRYPDRRRAREKVKDAIRSGKILPANQRQCVDCGKPAAMYDHYKGYHEPLSVEPVCHKCNGQRIRERGEFKGIPKKKAGRVLDGQVWIQFPEAGE